MNKEHPLKLTPFYIFLDMDGVLNSTRCGIAYHSYTKHDLDPVACRMLDRAIFELDSEYNCSVNVVISSTWRLHNNADQTHWPLANLQEWQSMFDSYNCFNLGAAIIGFTGSGFNGHRGQQIQEWRKDNLIESFDYVAIDDDWLDIEEMHPIIKCDHSIGFSVENFKSLIQIGKNIADEVKQSIFANGFPIRELDGTESSRLDPES